MTVDVGVRERGVRFRHAQRPSVAPSPSPADDSFDRRYWLRHCEGYRVDGAEGRIGFVEAVRGTGDAVELAVRAGRLGRRVLLVSADEVEFIVPRAERIWLKTPAAIRGSELIDARQAA